MNIPRISKEIELLIFMGVKSFSFSQISPDQASPFSQVVREMQSSSLKELSLKHMTF